MKILILIVIAFLLLTFACMNLEGADYDCDYNCKDYDSEWLREYRKK